MTKLYTSGAKSLFSLDLVETYKTIDSVATGSIPFYSVLSGLLKKISK